MSRAVAALARSTCLGGLMPQLQTVYQCLPLAPMHHHHLSTSSTDQVPSTDAAPSKSTPGPSGSSGAPGATPFSPQLHVTVEPLSGRFEGVSVLTLNRAEAGNAIGRQMLRELLDAVDLLRKERTTCCVLIKSCVPVFSLGSDQLEHATMTHQETAEYVHDLRRCFYHIQALPMPTVALLTGMAVGSGAELSLAADLRVASKQASFRFPEVTQGLMPGAGGTQRLAQLVGVSRAKDLIFTARKVMATEAAQMGLVNYLIDSDTAALDRALELAGGMAESAPLALRMSKTAISCPEAGQWRVEESCCTQLMYTRDRVEGKRAFMENRKPRFTGE
eukprot:CAMPEP_0119108292 /NCGR_PEP_ID=MMETSP1180-20130426/13571_1 /TAXON_ID=3052 ORGANISM="Chlamydomonas cf sp, Strain CCMP681" /NCGR_SAMPLE_ID=MMETSP1180 /ASSEMBLY_ACC=CAM_ASM_000741 /LENGTH=332 /DNA_ID=CAMNT_0007093889 /DNA_START=180 /DNA_END=1178 /DNA_ORIENTATION=-